MLALLRDPIWQFIGAILAFLGVGAAFWVYWLQRQIKELTFGEVSSRRLLSVADELSSRITVQLDGEIVTNLHLIVYGIKNSGHQAIPPGDFERPVSISFADGQVISAEVVAQSPKNLLARLTVDKSRIELQPLLLNCNDQILIQVLLSANSTESFVDARIINIPELAKVNRTRRYPPILKSAVPELVGIILLISFFLYLFGDDKKFAMFMFGSAFFSVAFSIFLHLLQRVGPSARRYIEEI